MPVLVLTRRRLRLVASALFTMTFSALPVVANAMSIAKTPTISGNGWVALLIIGVLVGTIYMLIMGALGVERRDAAIGRGRTRDNGWYGIFPAQSPDEEDAPDFHHHGEGDGGEAGG